MAIQADIEVVKIRDYLTYFYWGRHEDDPMMDMRLGGGSFAIHKGRSAIVIDTMARPGQGLWVRNYLEETFHINNFILVSSHWHVDHIVDNQVYADSLIISHKRTRDIMLEKKAAFESGKYGDYDAFKVVLPNLVFEDNLTLWLEGLPIELQEYKVHEEGHLGVYLPSEKIFIANDILEDPLWFFNFDFASAETQLAELDRLMAQDIDFIFPMHCSVDVIKRGGYNKELIQANKGYLTSMLNDFLADPSKIKAAPKYLEQALQDGVLHWWEPYTEVHEINKQSLLNI